MTKFFVDGAGKYLGAFDGAAPPAGAVEVPSAPEDAAQLWDGATWGPVPAGVVAARELADFDGGLLLKAVAIWTADKLGVARATARDEILAIYRGLK